MATLLTVMVALPYAILNLDFLARGQRIHCPRVRLCAVTDPWMAPKPAMTAIRLAGTDAAMCVRSKTDGIAMRPSLASAM